ncbi:MAG: peptidylprolyl isomerase, partial [Candidatus Melainabacteria bacterium]|nr:peptidylprolyl isomerase [Candidatus Melainabacteria bacterium]
IPSKVAKNGGDLGFQDKEHLIPKLSEALWPLKPGTVYPGLIQTALGFHIVKVTAHEPAGTSQLAEVKELLRAGVQQKKGNNALNQWLAKKHSTTKIVLAPAFAQLLLGSQAAGTTSSN